MQLDVLCVDETKQGPLYHEGDEDGRGHGAVARGVEDSQVGGDAGRRSRRQARGKAQHQQQQDHVLQHQERVLEVRLQRQTVVDVVHHRDAVPAPSRRGQTQHSQSEWCAIAKIKLTWRRWEGASSKISLHFFSSKFLIGSI